MTPEALLVLHEHGTGGGPVGPPPGLPVLTTCSLYVLVVLAGLLAAPALTGVAGRRMRTWALLAVGSAYGELIILQILRGEIAAAIGVAALIATVVGVLAGVNRTAGTQAAAGALLVATQLPIVGLEAGVFHLAFVVAHLAVAAVWAGGVAHLALVAVGAGRAEVGRAVRRFSPFAVGSAAALVGTGFALLLIHRVGIAVLTGTLWGHIVLAKLAGLALAALLGLGMRRSLIRRPRAALLRGEAVVLSGVVGLAAVLVAVPDPEPLVALAVPGLAQVSVGDGTVPLFLVDSGHGRGQLLYGGEPEPAVTVTDDRTGEVWRPRSPGATTTVSLADAAASLTVRRAGRSAHVTLHGVDGRAPSDDSVIAGSRSALAFALGRALAGTGQPVTRTAATYPAAGCIAATSGAAQGAAYARTLSRLGVRHVVVIGDAGAQARGFVAALRSGPLSVRRQRSPGAVPADAAILVVSRPDQAAAVLERLAARSVTGRGVYLAPWLLDGALLQRAATLHLPLVAVGSSLDPTAPIADDYRAAVVTDLPGLRPSIAGLFGYLSAADPAVTTTPRLVMYAAAPVGFLPGILNAGHDHGDEGAWFTTGTLAPISHPVRVAAHCIDQQTTAKD